MAKFSLLMLCVLCLQGCYTFPIVFNRGVILYSPKAEMGFLNRYEKNKENANEKDAQVNEEENEKDDGRKTVKELMR